MKTSFHRNKYDVDCNPQRKIWVITGNNTVVLNTITGKYVSHFTNEKPFREKIIVFNNTKTAYDYINRHNLNTNIFKIVIVQKR